MYCANIYLSCEIRQIRALLTDITSLPGNIKGYKEFCKSMYQSGITPDMLSQKKREILDIFKLQNTAPTSQGGDNIIEDHGQSLVVDDCSGTETSSIAGSQIDDSIVENQSRFPSSAEASPISTDRNTPPKCKRQIDDPNIHSKDDLKETAPYKAAYRGYGDTVESHLMKGASIEAMNKAGQTPLHCAVRNGHNSIVELLFTKGAKIDATDIHSNTPLHFAALRGSTSTVQLLLMKGASIEAMNKSKRTPLHCAARNGHTSTVELLLTKGAIINAMDIHSNTPLHFAALRGSTSTVELLLMKGALVDAMDIYSNTPLHFAALRGRTSIVELLLTKGSIIDAMDIHRNTPLHFAASTGRTSTAELKVPQLRLWITPCWIGAVMLVFV